MYIYTEHIDSEHKNDYNAKNLNDLKAGKIYLFFFFSVSYLFNFSFQIIIFKKKNNNFVKKLSGHSDVTTLDYVCS